DKLERSKEARMKLVNLWNKTYFNVTLTAAQLTDTRDYLLQGHTEEQALSRLFGKKVVFSGTPSQMDQQRQDFVFSAYQKFLGRTPSPTELANDKQALKNKGVAKYLLVLFTGSEYRTRTVSGYYSSILRRTQSPKAVEVDKLVNTGDDLTATRVLL